MGFFSDIAGIANIAGSIAGIGSNLLARDQANEGTAKGAAVNAAAVREGETRSLGTLNTGLERALADLQPLRTSGAAGGRILQREAFADPSVLTPGQRKALEEAQRRSRNQLATTGLRGAGRTQSRILQEVTDNFSNRAIEDNRSRSTAAADRLFGTGANATVAGASAELLTAARGAGEIGVNARGIGGVGANAAQTQGVTSADATLGSGRVFGDTLGAIAAQIADDRKRQATTGAVASGV